MKSDRNISDSHKILSSDKDLSHLVDPQSFLSKKQRLLEALYDQSYMADEKNRQSPTQNLKSDDLYAMLARKAELLERFNHLELEKLDPSLLEKIKHLERLKQDKRKVASDDPYRQVITSQQLAEKDPSDPEREKRRRWREEERLKRIMGSSELYNDNFRNAPSKVHDSREVSNRSQVSQHGHGHSKNAYHDRKKTSQEQSRPDSRSQNDLEVEYYGHNPSMKFPQRESPTRESNRYQRIPSEQNENIYQVQVPPVKTARPTSEMRTAPTGKIGQVHRKEPFQKVQESFFDKFGNYKPDLSESEKKRKYKEELDRLVKEKHEAMRQNYVEEQSRSPSPKGKITEFESPENDEKKRKWADEVMKEIMRQVKNSHQKPKPTELITEIQEESQHVSGFDYSRDEQVSHVHAKGQHYHNELSVEFPYYKGGQGKVVHSPPHQGNRGSVSVDKSIDIERKKRYKEDLDAMIEEKKKGKKKEDLPPERTSVESKPQPTNGGFFVRKPGDDEDFEKKQKLLAHQKHAEELKKQMEEKEQRKRLEKQKEKEEELKELARLQKEAEEERLKAEAEIAKKLQEQQESEFLKQPSAIAHQDQEESATETEQDLFRKEQGFQLAKDLEKESHREHAAQKELARKQLSQKGSPRGSPHAIKHQPAHHHHGEQSPIPHDPRALFPASGQHFHQPPPYYQNPGMPFGMYPPQMYQNYYDVMAYQGAPAQIYRELQAHRQIVDEVIEERKRLERIAHDERATLELYKQKMMKNLHADRDAFDREMDKIKTMVENPAVFNPETIGDSQLKTLHALNTAKKKHLEYYNQLLSQSHQSMQHVMQSYSQFPSQLPSQSINLPAHSVHLPSQAIQEDGKLRGPIAKKAEAEISNADHSIASHKHGIRESLPSSSDYVQFLAKNDMEKSFLRDLEAFKSIHKHVFNLDSKLIAENNLEKSNLSNVNPNLSSVYQSELRSPTPAVPSYQNNPIVSDLLRFTNSNPVTAHKSQFETNRTVDTNVDHQKASDLRELQTPNKDVSDYFANIIPRADTTPQVLYERSPDLRFANPNEYRAVSSARDTSIPNTKRVVKDISSQLRDVVSESPEFDRANMDTGKFSSSALKGIKKDLTGGQDSALRSFDMPLQKNTLKEDSRIAELRQMKDEIEREVKRNNKIPSRDPSPDRSPYKPLQDVDKLEIKMDDVSQDKSLIIAEDDEEYKPSDTSELDDAGEKIYRDVKKNLLKGRFPPDKEVFDPLKVVRIGEASPERRKMEAVAEKAMPVHQAKGSSIQMLKRNIEEKSKTKTDHSKSEYNPENYENRDKPSPERTNLLNLKESPIRSDRSGNKNELVVSDKKQTKSSPIKHEILKELSPIKSDRLDQVKADRDVRQFSDLSYKPPKPLEVKEIIQSANQERVEKIKQSVFAQDEPLQASGAIKTNSNSFHSGNEKRYKPPKTLDPFARVSGHIEQKPSHRTLEKKSGFEEYREAAIKSDSKVILEHFDNDVKMHIIGHSQNYSKKKDTSKSPDQAARLHQRIKNIYGEELASTIDMNDSPKDETKSESGRKVGSHESGKKKGDHHGLDHSPHENQRRSKLILDRLQRLLEGIDPEDENDRDADRIRETEEDEEINISYKNAGHIHSHYRREL